MKQLALSSLFLFFAWTSIGAEYHYAAQDSLEIYKKISFDKSLGFEKRLKATYNSIRLAKNISDSTYLSQLRYISTIYGIYKKYDQAILEASFLLKEATRLKQSYFIALAYDKQGRYKAQQDKNIEAFANYVKALDLYVQRGDSLRILNLSQRASFLQLQIGDLNGAEYTIVNALDYSDALTDLSELSWFYDVLGRVYRERKLWQESIRNHRKALQIETDPLSKVSLLNNYAITLIKANRFEEAVIELEKALAFNAKPSQRTKNRLLDNLAYAQVKLGNPEAILALKKTLQLRKADNDLTGQFATHLHLAEAYTNLTDNKAKVQYHAEQAFNIAGQLNNNEDAVKALYFLIPVSPNSNALFELRSKLSDSIEGVQNKAKFEFAKLRYDVEKAEERESLALRLKSASELREEIAVRRRNWAFAGLFAAALLTLFVILYQRERSKKQRLLDQHNTEKRIAKKLHDELANEIYLVMSQIESENATPTVADKLENIYKLSRDISRETHPIETDKSFPEELALSLQTYTSDDRKLIMRGLETIPWDTINAKKKIEIYRVLQELMTNMRKHSKASLVAIVFKQENKALEINYSDNGKGVVISSQDRNGGLINTESRLKSIGGHIKFDSAINQGFRAALTIPMK